jgi:hypothetical protein
LDRVGSGAARLQELHGDLFTQSGVRELHGIERNWADGSIFLSD